MISEKDAMQQLKRGCDEILLEAELQEKLKRGKAFKNQGWVRSHGAGSAPRPHRID